MIIFFAPPSSMICCCYVTWSSLFIESKHSSFFPSDYLSERRFVSHLRLSYTFRGVSRPSDVERSV